MRRLAIGLALALVLLAAGAPIAGLGWPANAQTSADASDLTRLKEAITGATANESQDLEVSATSMQIVVTVMNSPLLAAGNAEREGEARLIAAAIAETISKQPALATVQTLHIDYARKPNAGSAKEIVDGIDFRRDTRGVFQLHRT